MRNQFLMVLLIGFVFISFRSIAQSEADIANTSVELKGRQVQITYDILNSSKRARFEVWIEISGPDGHRLEVSALKGDIGPNITAGTNKVIIWDPDADSIFLNALIDIQVFANMTVIIDEEQESETEQPSKTYNRTAIILQSVAFPGLGLTRVTGKPHWIKGVAGYGCIAGAILLNKKAVSSYADYGIADSQEEANSLLSSSITQDNISQGLAYAAIAIWVTDLTWTIIGTSEMKKRNLSGNRTGISIDADYDVLSSTPLLTFRYIF